MRKEGGEKRGSCTEIYSKPSNRKKEEYAEMFILVRFRIWYFVLNNYLLTYISKSFFYCWLFAYIFM